MVADYLKFGKTPCIEGYRYRQLRSEIRRWVKPVKIHDYSCLMHKFKLWSFEEKLWAVNEIKNGRSYIETSAQLGMASITQVIDWWNNFLWDLAQWPSFDHVQKTLDKAFSKFAKLDNLVLHSDQGWHYWIERYKEQLRIKSISQSMSRRGNCWDNSIMEQFFGKLKTEMFYGREKIFKSINDLKKEISRYIVWYNNDRIQIKLNGMSPVRYRLMQN